MALLDPPARLGPLLDRYRTFLEEEVLPVEEAFLARGFPAVEELVEACRRRAREAGVWLPQLPAEWGGLGLTLTGFAHVARILGRSPLGHLICNCQAPDSGNLELLLHHGSDAQRERFLRPLAAGTVRSCFAMTEPDRPGSNPVWMDTTATRDGDGWVLEGRKWFATSADGAAFAVVMAVTDPEAPRHRRASMFLVPTDTPGYRLVENLPVMGHRGSGWASHGEVAFEGCRVPADHLLGAEGEGFALAQERLGPGRIHHCMRWLGIADRAFEMLCRRACERRLAPGLLLGDKEVVQEWIADSRAAIHASGLMVLDAASRIDSEGNRAAREEVSIIKFFVARTMLQTLDRAIQAHGGLGVTDRTPLAHFYRHERAARIYDGADEVHRELVARLALRRHGFVASHRREEE